VSFLSKFELSFLKNMASKQNSNSAQNSSKNRVIYSEFGQNTDSAALERAKPDLPPAQQNLKIEASRKGRKGKTVTVISGFQTSNETLEKLVKQLKTQCGSGGTLKEDTIEIQGDHAQKLLEMLTKLGYKAKISGR
jgi:translation initiation factor 1